MLKNKKVTGSRVIGPDRRPPFTRRQLLKLEIQPKIWWLRSPVLVLIFPLLLASDVSSMYNILNAALPPENYLLLWITVISLSLMFVVLPSIMAYTVRQRAPKDNKPPMSHVIVPEAALFLLFSAVSFLRFVARDSAFAQGNYITSLSATAGSTQTGTGSLTTIALTLVFCMAILSTVVIAWRIGWEICDPSEQEIKKFKIRRCEMMEKLNQLMVVQAGYEARGKSNYSRADLDFDKYQAALGITRSQADYLREHVRVRLMLTLNNPTATSMLSVPLDADQAEVNKPTVENKEDRPS
ncbi:MAG: hypothetical protein ABF497_08110 [Sporolactobacillus sp.]